MAVLAVDDVPDVEGRLYRLRSSLPVQIAPARAGATLADVRRVMLRTALGTGASVLILADADDALLPQCLVAHLATLEFATISYGDMEVMGSARTFFEGAAVPNHVASSAALLMRNFMGFGNTAVHAQACAALADSLPRDITAVDWWFFTRLLEQGATAQRAARPVARYRPHSTNVTGPQADPDLAAVLRRCRIVQRHYGALPPTPARIGADASVSRLISALEDDKPGIRQIVAQACAAPGVWYDDIRRMTEILAAAR